ncbi:hypothetical protein [Roseicyclus persicicus]|uniref:Lipoprotein n=1 Tax=Roseicyclus persicicus TaxID=2650661 RepID=A0A7X6GVW2_9RHOB|nr:hypothetical protein [Roseibacterium persicicum]NKX43367.1 hypothetical protein [Roseibacterium persicicum]
MMRLIPLFVFFALAGCATDVMRGFVGQDVTAVMVRYGPPVAQFDLPDGRTAFQWATSTPIIAPMTTTVTGYGNFATAQTTGGYLGQQNCVYTLYAAPNQSGSFTITGFEQPTFDCM